MLRVVILGLAVACARGSLLTEVGAQLPSELNANAEATRQLAEEGSGDPSPSPPPPSLSPTPPFSPGVGSPPPPMPLSPPTPPALPGTESVTEYVSNVVMIAEGSVADYTTEKRKGIIQAFANSTGVTEDNVTVTIQSASVLINAIVRLDTPSQAAETTYFLQAKLATPSYATSFFEEYGGTEISVLSQPVVFEETRKVWLYPPPPPFPPPLINGGGDSLDGGAIAGIIIGTLAGTALLGEPHPHASHLTPHTPHTSHLTPLGSRLTSRLNIHGSRLMTHASFAHPLLTAAGAWYYFKKVKKDGDYDSAGDKVMYLGQINVSGGI